jgi:hypothetical protein
MKRSRTTGRFILLAAYLVAGLPVYGKTAVEVLQEAAERWKGVHDYSAYFRQRNSELSGESMFLGKLSLCRLPEDTDRAYLRLDYFDTKDDPSADGPPVIETGPLRDLYFSDGETLWHYRPNENQVTMEWLSAEGPFPEILLIAGFLKLDIEKFRETHYFKPVVIEPIQGQSTYRVSIVPKGDAKELEPLRDLWLAQDSLLPARVATGGEISVVVDLWMQKTDQQLDPQSLIPVIPKSAEQIDLRRHTR